MIREVPDLVLTIEGNNEDFALYEMAAMSLLDIQWVLD